MTSRWHWILKLIGRRLWVRASLISLLAVASALIALFVAPYLPTGLSAQIGANSVGSILTIIASSMLAVTTFSLSTMVAAYSGATSNVTPRATKLLIEDSTAQNVLATFVGSFLYSLVALITLSTGAYGERGRIVLFVVTVFVILLIVVTLLRWIDYLMRFGRVGETTALVERKTGDALKARRDNPYLGGMIALDKPIEGAVPVFPTEIGYVQHIDVAALQHIAEDVGQTVHLCCESGSFVDPGRPLAFVTGAEEERVTEAVRESFTIADERTFDQDPRFGLSVLSEIASRALSPAVNDPGTAIDVIGRAVRLLSIWAAPHEIPEPEFSAVYVAPIALGDLFDDIFHPIARDGAGLAEVHIRLQKALEVLSRTSDPRYRAEAMRHSRMALTRCMPELSLENDRERVRSAAAWADKAAN